MLKELAIAVKHGISPEWTKKGICYVNMEDGLPVYYLNVFGQGWYRQIGYKAEMVKLTLTKDIEEVVMGYEYYSQICWDAYQPVREYVRHVCEVG